MDLERFYKRVGIKLAIVPATQALKAADRDLIKTAWESLHAVLDVNELTRNTADDPVPEELADPLIDMVAATLVDDFGLGEPRRSAIRGEGLFGLPAASPAERRLRKVLSLPGLEKSHNEFY